MSHRINLLSPRISWAERLARMEQGPRADTESDFDGPFAPRDDAERLASQRSLITTRLLLAAIRRGAEEITILNSDDNWQAAFQIDGDRHPIDLRTLASLPPSDEWETEPKPAAIPEWAFGRSIVLELSELAGLNMQQGVHRGRFGLLLKTAPRLEIRFDVTMADGDDGQSLGLVLSERVGDDEG